MRAFLPVALVLSVIAVTGSAVPSPASFPAYESVLAAAVHGSTVDYKALKRDRRELDAALASFSAPDTLPEQSWTRDERFAFWINAYNAFTIATIVNQYPIRGSWFSLAPRNSIRQIDRAWTTQTWRAAGREVTLDQIEHKILRPTFKDPRVHFAINCASRSCPPVRNEPYVAGRLDGQLDDAARQYLRSPSGLQIDGEVLKVSNIFKWYGEDFVERYARAIPQHRSARERAVLGVIAECGPPAAVALAKSGRARIGFLRYDWSLNDREP
ncbi:MAG: DUF547 domain-containing protein [Acidobacteria bacterium]|nr:DUF547 domain-containing protein [Acidobacteriota bacterium]